MYIKRLNSGRVSAYLRPCKLTTGNYGIETRTSHCLHFELNINLPLFPDCKTAEKWLSENYEQEVNPRRRKSTLTRQI